jgi:hypothetical protein
MMVILKVKSLHSLLQLAGINVLEFGLMIVLQMKKMLKPVVIYLKEIRPLEQLKKHMVMI